MTPDVSYMLLPYESTANISKRMTVGIMMNILKPGKFARLVILT